MGWLIALIYFLHSVGINNRLFKVLPNALPVVMIRLKYSTALPVRLGRGCNRNGLRCYGAHLEIVWMSSFLTSTLHLKDVEVEF